MNLMVINLMNPVLRDVVLILTLLVTLSEVEVWQ